MKVCSEETIPLKKKKCFICKETLHVYTWQLNVTLIQWACMSRKTSRLSVLWIVRHNFQLSCMLDICKIRQYLLIFKGSNWVLCYLYTHIYIYSLWYTQIFKPQLVNTKHENSHSFAHFCVRMQDLACWCLEEKKSLFKSLPSINFVHPGLGKSLAHFCHEKFELAFEHNWQGSAMDAIFILLIRKLHTSITLPVLEILGTTHACRSPLKQDILSWLKFGVHLDNFFAPFSLVRKL